MAIKLNSKYLKGFVNEHELRASEPQVKAAHRVLSEKTGLGNDFLGWTTLPADYDRGEFARIKAAAARIREDSDILLVIGIGGSYLGARAALELLRSPYYNNLKKDTPDIYFVGNSISPDYLNTILALCEGKRVSVNIISKSGTTTEPALAFRVFRELLEQPLLRADGRGPAADGCRGHRYRRRHGWRGRCDEGARQRRSVHKRLLQVRRLPQHPLPQGQGGRAACQLRACVCDDERMV